MNPTLITAADLCAFLDENPAVEARAMLSRGRLLRAAEIEFLAHVARGGAVTADERELFPALRDRIMRRWSASRRSTDLQSRGLNRGTAGRSVDRPGAAAPAAPALSSSRPADAQGRPGPLSAGPGAAHIVASMELFTRLPDGRIVFPEDR